MGASPRQQQRAPRRRALPPGPSLDAFTLNLSPPLHHTVTQGREVSRQLGEAPPASVPRRGGLLRVPQGREAADALGAEVPCYLASRRPGPPLVFPVPPPRILICNVCEDVLDDPVLLTCGHTFCRGCVAPGGYNDVMGGALAPRPENAGEGGAAGQQPLLPQTNNSGTLPGGKAAPAAAAAATDRPLLASACPACGEPFNPTDTHADAPRAAAVGELRVFCRYASERLEGGLQLRMLAGSCRAELRGARRAEHEAACAFAAEQCSLVDDTDAGAPRACPVVVRRAHMAEHRRRCAFRRERCTRCRRRVVARRMREHAAECGAAACPYGCGAVLRPEEVQAHAESACPEAPLRCAFVDNYAPLQRSAAAAAALDAGAANGGLDDDAAERALQAAACGAPRGQGVRCSHLCRRGQMAAHRAVCELRPWRCPDCREGFAARRGAQHARECPAATVHCANCGRALLRASLRAHLEAECPSRCVACPFAEMGCSARMVAAEVAEHLERNAGGHAELAARYASEQGARVATLQEGLSELRGELAAERAERRAEGEAAARAAAQARQQAAAEGAALTAEVDWVAELARSGAESAAREAARRQRSAEEHAAGLYSEAVATRRAAERAAEAPEAQIKALKSDLSDLRLRSDERADEARDSVAALIAAAVKEQRREAHVLRERLAALEQRLTDDVALLMYGASG